MASVAAGASAKRVAVFGVDFLGRYDVKERIGKGFYAKVHRCVRRADGAVLAVKSIDVRPLRLRENFSRERLMREVDILQRLHHPSIIRLVEATWNAPVGGDHLLLVMEFAPGQELFDMIITKGKFSEQDARQIVAQLVSALQYCHARDIVHRDVKPENILLVSADQVAAGGGSDGGAGLNNRLPPTSRFIVKLLDFGLSRTVGASGATTFAGTPEYFAPEVDPRRRAGGAAGSYGVAADCWSLGAVVFVMLSGVFPEFSGEGANRTISFARASYWGHVSAAAKDMIGQMMHPDPNQRLTMAGAAAHPWLRDLLPAPSAEAPVQEMAGLSVAGAANPAAATTTTTTTAAPTSAATAGTAAGNGNGATGARDRRAGSGHKRGRVPTPGEPTQEASAGTDAATGGVLARPPDLADVRLGADAIAFLETDHLFLLQNQLATLFHDAYLTYAAERDSQMTTTIRAHAVECRQLFKSSAALMNKLGGTAENVIKVLPDLRLGVEENEPELAEIFFTKIKGWISDLKTESRDMMNQNSQAIRALNISMENAKQGLFETVAVAQDAALALANGPSGGGGSSKTAATAAAFPLSQRAMVEVVDGTSPMIEELRPRGSSLFRRAAHNNQQGAAHMDVDVDSGAPATEPEIEELSSPTMAAARSARGASDLAPLSVGAGAGAAASSASSASALVLTPPRSPSGTAGRKTATTALATEGWKRRVRHLQQALAKLTQVDRILGGFSMFWDHMETAVSLLSQRNEHVESLLAFTKNPRLKSRFFDRLDEYANMWRAVQMASTRYALSERSDDPSVRGRAGGTARARSGGQGEYKFLQLEDGGGHGDAAQRGRGTDRDTQQRQASFDAAMEIEVQDSL